MSPARKSSRRPAEFPPKRPALVAFTFHMNPEVKAGMERIAQLRECSIGTIYREAIRNYLKAAAA